MNINLISFLDPLVYFGGGEMMARALIRSGMERGHKISISSVRPNRKYKNTNKPDLTFFLDIFNNAHTLASLGAWRSFGRNYLNEQMDKGPFVHLTNAYADICNLGYLPCNGESSDICSFKQSLSLKDKIIIKDFGCDCFALRDTVKRLYEDSILNVYVSPLHKEISERVINLKHKKDSFILKPLIDSDRFYNMNIERDIDYLFVGIIGEAKGFYEMREKFNDSNIHLIGKISPGINLDFGTHHGHLPYQEIPEYMNRAKNFVFFPRWPEPQGRVVVEAALCGCNILGNENVGALSFPMDLSDQNNYKNVEREFWEKIENLNI